MYSYSPVEKILIKNFRNIGEVEIDFTESPIIAFLGENESGKTSVSKAFAVCSLHANARDQKDYIRDGTNGFGIAIKLKDGSLITRIKTATLNRYQVEQSDGQIWETNKIDAGLPVQVSKLMGLIEEPETKEFLHIRTYEDQLLFVVTPASTNYKVMYDALKVDQITRAIKAGNIQANNLKATINKTEISIEALTENLRGMKVLDIEPLVNIKKRLIEQREIIKKLAKAKEIIDRVNVCKKQLGALELIHENNLKEINLLEVTRLNEINRIIERNNKLYKLCNINNKLHTLKEIEINSITRIESVIINKKELEKKKAKARALIQVSSLSEINEYTAQQLNRAKQLYIDVNRKKLELGRLHIEECNLIEQRDFDQLLKIDRVRQLIKRNSLLDTEAIKSETYVQQVKDYFKACGARVITCNKCGEQIVMEAEA